MISSNADAMQYECEILFCFYVIFISVFKVEIRAKNWEKSINFLDNTQLKKKYIILFLAVYISDKYRTYNSEKMTLAYETPDLLGTLLIIPLLILNPISVLLRYDFSK